MSAQPPSEQYAESASCSAAPGMPSGETIERALNLAARAMHRQFGANDTEEAIEAAIWQHLRPAFEAKDAEIERLKALPVIADYIEVQDARRAAEAKLAQAVEANERLTAAVAPFANEGNWFVTTHRPEVPGPVESIVYFSTSGGPWRSSDLQPWKAAILALAEGKEG